MENKNLSQLDIEETKETIEILQEISQILNCGINRETLTILISMVENGANPEALAAVIKEMRKESFSLSNSEIFKK